ncbi:hypothetical protein K438DRAFT_1762159 [Mycena galopus ATCC 62051]|nr:hypothetical protein K438DRAFT_1762159 [Mycena galopus ATCC 62051]
MPAYILVKMARTRANQLEGLDEHVIPIEPAQVTYHVKFELPDHKSTQRTIRRRQFPMTGAYAFTDYRSQGQTIQYVLVDIASPPSGKLSLFKLYVALSQSSGRETIRLLRDFDDDLFMQSHDPSLLAEDDRLEGLNNQTRAWWTEMRSKRSNEDLDLRVIRPQHRAQPLLVLPLSERPRPRPPPTSFRPSPPPYAAAHHQERGPAGEHLPPQEARARPHHRRHLRARWGDDDASGSATRPFSAVSKPPPALRNAVRSSRACAAASSNSRQTAAGTASSRGARLRGDEVSSLIVSELLRGDPGTTLVNKHACMCGVSALVDPTGAADLGVGRPPLLIDADSNSSLRQQVPQGQVSRGFENLEESAKDGIVDELLVEGSTVFSKVAKSQWGSYCVEHILAHAPEKQPSMALEYFLTGLLEFATNEQGSKSVVKALKEGGKATLDRVVQRMCEPTKCARRAMIVDLTLSLTGSQLIAAVLPTADKDRRAALCDGNAARLQDRLQGYLAPLIGSKKTGTIS